MHESSDNLPHETILHFIAATMSLDFFSLPGEIRNEIYSYSLPHHTNPKLLYLDIHSSAAAKDPSKQDAASTSAVLKLRSELTFYSLHLTCRQIHAELPSIEQLLGVGAVIPTLPVRIFVSVDQVCSQYELRLLSHASTVRFVDDKFLSIPKDLYKASVERDRQRHNNASNNRRTDYESSFDYHTAWGGRLDWRMIPVREQLFWNGSEPGEKTQNEKSSPKLLQIQLDFRYMGLYRGILGGLGFVPHSRLAGAQLLDGEGLVTDEEDAAALNFLLRKAQDVRQRLHPERPDPILHECLDDEVLDEILGKGRTDLSFATKYNDPEERKCAEVLIASKVWYP